MKRFLKRLLIIIPPLIIASVLAFVIIIEYAPIKGFKNLNSQALLESSGEISVLDDSGKSIAPLSKSRSITTLSSLNQHTIDAFLAVEDKRFFYHNGLDYLRMAKAAATDILSLSFKEGASTITQQLAKNTHLNGEKSLKRKLNEMQLARKIERKYSKREILEMYLNNLYFGKGIYGISTAASAFFNKSASNLTLRESALLAAVINNPSLFSLYDNYENAKERSEIILKLMLSQSKITDVDYALALRECPKISEPPSDYKQASYLINSALTSARLQNTKKTTVHSTINQKTQMQIKAALESQKKEKPFLDFSAVLLNNNGAEIEAVYSTASTNQCAIKRQPASVLKPIICYAPALEYKHITPLTPINDEPINYGGYRAQNMGGICRGWISCEEALYKSYNIPAVKLLNINGIARSKRFANGLGIEFDKNDNSLSLALGGMTYGVELDKLAAAYAAFANLGIYQKPTIIKSIEQNNKQIHKSASPKKQAMREDTAALINSMLKKTCTQGTARALSGFSYEICAKTGTAGTAKGNTDALCVAYTSAHTLAIRASSASDALLDNSITGGSTAAVAAKEIFSLLYQTNPPAPLKKSNLLSTCYVYADELYKRHNLMLATDPNKKTNLVKGDFSIHNLPTAPRP